MYAKTHNNIEPGVQKKRSYAWGDIEPETQAFGLGEHVLPGGASRAIHAERTEEFFPKTVIVKKTVEDQRSVAYDPLGQVKNLGQGAHPVAKDAVFGARSLKDRNEWNAAKCLVGEPTERELMPDNDLGRCTKVGARNMVRRE
jgi:hypothetical protein